MVRLKVIKSSLITIVSPFQFLSGAIKRIISYSENQSQLMFQFLSGAIKSYYLKYGNNVFKKFQFLSGAIKRTPNSRQAHPVSRFNS